MKWCVSGTVSEKVVFDVPAVANGGNQTAECSACGYPLRSGVHVCPNCGQQVGVNAQAAPQQVRKEVRDPQPPLFRKKAFDGTIKGTPLMGVGGTNGSFTLRPVKWDNEDKAYEPTTYTGERIVLNRANTDAQNRTITSKEQAVLTFEDGEWYIENCSDFKTTYVRVDGKVKLKSGDVIVLGNREFEFKA